MGYNNNYGSNQYPEYQSTYGGDSTNGYSGSQTPQSIGNAVLQGKTTSGGNPSDTFMSAANSWWAAMNPQAKQANQGQQLPFQGANPYPGQTNPVQYPGGATGGQGGAGAGTGGGQGGLVQGPPPGKTTTGGGMVWDLGPVGAAAGGGQGSGGSMFDTIMNNRDPQAQPIQQRGRPIDRGDGGFTQFTGALGGGFGGGSGVGNISPDPVSGPPQPLPQAGQGTGAPLPSGGAYTSGYDSYANPWVPAGYQPPTAAGGQGGYGPNGTHYDPTTGKWIDRDGQQVPFGSDSGFHQIQPPTAAGGQGGQQPSWSGPLAASERTPFTGWGPNPTASQWDQPPGGGTAAGGQGGGGLTSGYRGPIQDTGPRVEQPIYAPGYGPNGPVPQGPTTDPFTMNTGDPRLAPLGGTAAGGQGGAGVGNMNNTDPVASPLKLAGQPQPSGQGGIYDAVMNNRDPVARQISPPPAQSSIPPQGVSELQAAAEGGDSFAQWVLQQQEREQQQGQTQTQTNAGGGYQTGGVDPMAPYTGGGGGGGGSSLSSGSSSGSTTPLGGAIDPGQFTNPYLGNLESSLRDAWSRQSSESARQLRATGAQSGLQDSGAWASANADMYANLAASRANQLTPMMFEGGENAQQRALDASLGNLQASTSRYSANRSAGATVAAARLGADASRYGYDRSYQSNRESNSQRDRSDQLNYMLGQAGISQRDRESILNYDLGQSGISQKDRSDQLNYMLGQAGVSQRDREAILNYNLGSARIGADVYGGDQRDRQYWADLLQRMGPEQLAAMLLGPGANNSPIATVRNP